MQWPRGITHTELDILLLIYKAEEEYFVVRYMDFQQTLLPEPTNTDTNISAAREREICELVSQ